MTDSNQAAMVFSNLGQRKIQADFAGGKLTSDAGAALLREVDRHIGLIDALADCITDPRQTGKTTLVRQVLEGTNSNPQGDCSKRNTILAQRLFY